MLLRLEKQTGELLEQKHFWEPVLEAQCAKVWELKAQGATVIVESLQFCKFFFLKFYSFSQWISDKNPLMLPAGVREKEPSWNMLSSVQFSHSVISDSLRPHGSQHARPPCPSPTPGVHPNSCALSQWCHLAFSSSVVPFPSCPQSLLASGSFPISQLFTWGGQSTGVSASISVLPMNSQDWSPLGWTGWISLQSKGLSRVFSNTTFQKHQFFSAQLSSQSNSHIHTWPLEKP